jgi:predicted RNA-binding Zn-ribbon protein involved in translation (DUF1610 family)
VPGINPAVLYAVCTSCSFLRAYSREGSSLPAPDRCPACGSELVLREGEGRFPPTYVSRVSLDLLATPELHRHDPPDRR